jgi:riboflavin kinase / FMN adenylyltransferase
MAVYYNMEGLPAFNRAVVTIGTFDGVHTGHRAILNEVVAHAQSAGGESVLITFDPHPRKLLFPDQPVGIITPLQKKLELITNAGIQHIVVVPFTAEFAAMSAREYVELFLVSVFQPQSIIIGYDHRFGHDRAGDIHLLKQFSSGHDYEVVEIPAKLIDHAAVSSTKIRNAIKFGAVDEANEMLGREYSFAGTVVHGKKLGRTLGYPTANIDPSDPDQILPGNGIYSVKVLHGGRLHGGMMSIGYNPTVTDTTDLKIEVNIFDFDKDIYGQSLEVFVVKKLREELKFKSIEELINQLLEDKKNSINVHFISNSN